MKQKKSALEKKAAQECARQLWDHLSSIPLFHEDWHEYGGRGMPAAHMETLERISSEIFESDVQDLIDWLKKAGHNE